MIFGSLKSNDCNQLVKRFPCHEKKIVCKVKLIILLCVLILLSMVHSQLHSRCFNGGNIFPVFAFVFFSIIHFFWPYFVFVPLHTCENTHTLNRKEIMKLQNPAEWQISKLFSFKNNILEYLISRRAEQFEPIKSDWVALKNQRSTIWSVSFQVFAAD